MRYVLVIALALVVSACGKGDLDGYPTEGSKVMVKVEGVRRIGFRALTNRQLNYVNTVRAVKTQCYEIWFKWQHGVEKMPASYDLPKNVKTYCDVQGVKAGRDANTRYDEVFGRPAYVDKYKDQS